MTRSCTMSRSTNCRFGSRSTAPGSSAMTAGPMPARSTTVADARFAKPLDTDLVNRLAREHEVLITIEEGAIGGFASHVLHHLATTGQLDQGLKIRPMVLPDIFIDHDSQSAQYDVAGLNAKHIVATALAALGREIAEQPARA